MSELDGADVKLPAPREMIQGILSDKFINGLSYPELIKKYRVSKRTIQRWLAHTEVLKIRVELAREATKSRLIVKSEEIAENLLDSIDAETIQTMSGLQKATAFGIVLDKSRLLRNEATQIHEIRLDPEVIQLRKVEIVAELHRRGLIDKQI